MDRSRCCLSVQSMVPVLHHTKFILILSYVKHAALGATFNVYDLHMMFSCVHDSLRNNTWHALFFLYIYHTLPIEYQAFQFNTRMIHDFRIIVISFPLTTRVQMLLIKVLTTISGYSSTSLGARITI